MPNIINDLNVDRIILDLHIFLKSFPSSVWRDQPSDTPLRTVKTMLHSLAKILGHKVRISELPSSTDLPYFIRKSVINTEVRIPVIKYGNMKIQTCVYIAATVANILHALHASFNS